MDTLDAAAKNYGAINQAAGDFLPKLSGQNIVKDIAITAEMAGLMLLRDSSVDLSQITSGTAILGAVQDAAAEQLTRFVMSMAFSCGLNPSEMDFASIPAEAKKYIPELTQYEEPFQQICKDRGISKEHFAYTAAASAIKLAGAGNQLKMLNQKIGLALVLFHIAAGSKTVPYPAGKRG